MNALEQSPNNVEQEKVVFILEQKINPSEVENLKNTSKEVRNVYGITAPQLLDLNRKFDKSWVCADALSYADTLKELIPLAQKYIEFEPDKKFRIIQAKAHVHNEYGIALTNYNVKEVKVIKTPATLQLHKLKCQIKQLFKPNQKDIIPHEELSSNTQSISLKSERKENLSSKINRISINNNKTPHAKPQKVQENSL